MNIAMEDEKLKKELAKIPDADKNGDPIYKIANVEKSGGESADRMRKDKKRETK